MVDKSLASAEEARRRHEQIRFNLGPEVLAALDDPDVTDVMVNPDGKLWIDTHSRGQYDSGKRVDPDRTLAALNLISGVLDQELTAASPTLQGELPIDGNRIQAWIPPVVEAPCFAIRKRSAQHFSFADYVEREICAPNLANAVRQAIADDRPILVVGGTGSGKTTLGNAILAEIVSSGPRGPNARIYIIEDTKELQCTAANRLETRTSPPGATTQHLVRAGLRGRPDYFVIGEVRGEEAYDLLQAWNTGHGGGVATLHANDAELALHRLNQLATAGSGGHDQRFSIAISRVFVVFIAGRGTDRRVREVLSVDGVGQGPSPYQLSRLVAPTPYQLSRLA